MLYYLMLFISRILSLFSPSTALSVGRKMAFIIYPFVPRRRKLMAIANAQKCLGLSESEAQKVIYQSVENLALTLVEVLRFPTIKKDMQNYISVEGENYLQEALALKRGVILATAHSGNWELLGGALAFLDIPIVGVAMKQRQEAMDRFINAYRKLIGIEIVDKKDVRTMYRFLQEGKVIGLLMDQYIGDHDAVKVDFLGQKTNSVQGPAALARFRNAPIVMAFITRNEDGTHHIKIYPAIFVSQTEEKRKDIKEAMQLLNNLLAEYIKEHPTDWFWLHDRFKIMKNF